jgi:hypothetical protein
MSHRTSYLDKKVTQVLELPWFQLGQEQNKTGSHSCTFLALFVTSLSLHYSLILTLFFSGGQAEAAHFFLSDITGIKHKIQSFENAHETKGFTKIRRV